MKALYILTRSFWSTLAVAVTVYALLLFFFPASFFFGVPKIVGYGTMLVTSLWFAGYVRLKWVRVIEVKRYVA